MTKDQARALLSLIADLAQIVYKADPAPPSNGQVPAEAAEAVVGAG